MAKFRPTVKATSRQRGEVNTEVHGREAVHETTEQASVSARQVERSDADDTWVRPTNLTAPPERSGFKQRWIRVRIGDKADPKRLSRARQEGWRPRPPDTVPEDIMPETASLDGIGNVISVDDMVLMEMPIAKFRSKQRHFEEKRQRQQDIVSENLMKVEREGGQPIHRYRKSKVEVGRGRRAARIPDTD